MKWKILYHPDVMDDLDVVGPSAARRIMRAIDEKLTCAPLEFGSGLSGNLASFRKLRIGDYRVVYQVREKDVIVVFGFLGRLGVLSVSGREANVGWSLRDTFSYPEIMP